MQLARDQQWVAQASRLFGSASRRVVHGARGIHGMVVSHASWAAGRDAHRNRRDACATQSRLRRKLHRTGIDSRTGCALVFFAIALLGIGAHAAEPALSFPRTPATAPEQAAATMRVLHGFRMELLAAEPLVTDPVAIAYDEDGRAYVCEMNDYPYTDKAHHKAGQENPTDQPIGKVRLLIDDDGDGKFDRSTVFADGLSWPTGVACWKGGVFVAATPDIWYFKDTDGDGVADVRQKVFTGFKKLNVQAVMNNLVWGLDNRLYGAGGTNGGEIRPVDHAAGPWILGRNDFRFDPVQPAESFELISGGARFGNTFDDWGNRFLCNIRNPAEHVVLPSRYLARNPFLAVRSAISEVAAAGDQLPVYRISPVETWREVRARRWAGERDNPMPRSELVGAGVVTSSSGITVYRGAAYPPEFQGNIFTAECAGNLFYRQRLTPDGVTFRAERVDGTHEMVASTDTWFRPVNLVNAPDGTLHVCDMYREVIEHPWSIPDDIHAQLDLESGRDRGRLWRLAPPGFVAPMPPHLSTASVEQLVEQFANPNSWWRETAQRLLIERQDQAAVAPLRAALEKAPDARARLHALHTLDGLKALRDDDLLHAFRDAHEAVRAHAVRLAEPRVEDSEPLRTPLFLLATDPSAIVRFQVAFSLGEMEGSRAAAGLLVILKHDAADPWVSTAVLSSANKNAGLLLEGLLRDREFTKTPAAADVLRQLASIIGARHDARELAAVFAALAPPEAARQAPISGLGEGLKRAGRSLRQAAADAPAVGELLDAAPTLAQRPDAALTERVEAVKLLAFDDFARVRPVFAALLHPREPQEIQRAAVEALATFNSPEVAALLLDRWATFTPAVRADVVLALLGNRNRILPLLDAIAAGRVAANQVPPARRAVLLHSKDAEIQSRAARLFANEQAGRAEVIKRYEAALRLTGDPARGEKVYQANCMICHRHGPQGNNLGPDLGTVRQWLPEQILTNILDPNREVAPNFVTYAIEQKDGGSLVGLIADETPNSLTLKTPDNVAHVLLRQNLASVTNLGVSLMPEGLEAAISPEAMADLLAFLRQ